MTHKSRTRAFTFKSYSREGAARLTCRPGIGTFAEQEHLLPVLDAVSSLLVSSSADFEHVLHVDETPPIRAFWSRPGASVTLVHLTRDRGERVEALLLLVAGTAGDGAVNVLSAIGEYAGKPLAGLDFRPVVDVMTGIVPPVAGMIFITPAEDLGITTVALVCAAFFASAGDAPGDDMDQ